MCARWGVLTRRGLTMQGEVLPAEGVWRRVGLVGRVEPSVRVSQQRASTAYASPDDPGGGVPPVGPGTTGQVVLAAHELRFDAEHWLTRSRERQRNREARAGTAGGGRGC